MKIIFLLLLPSIAISQEADHQFWMDYNLNMPVNEKFSYGGDIGLRGFISNSNWNQIIIRPTARYRFNKIINVGGGISGFLRFNNDSENVYEFRIQEEMNIRWPDISLVYLFYRVRFDQQFFTFTESPNTRGGRVRYLAGISSQDLAVFGENNPIYLQFFWEGFKALGKSSVKDTFINQARYTFIFGHRITSSMRYEINYINQTKRGAMETSFRTTENILRLRLFHRIKSGPN